MSRKKSPNQLDLFGDPLALRSGESAGVKGPPPEPAVAEPAVAEPARVSSPSPRPAPPAGGAGEIPLPEGLRLERNLAILAGAGAGKTYSLVSMCLHLLGGARPGFAPIACAELGLLTFTEKAADEMRGRLRERLDALAEGRGDEPALRESFEAAGRPFPPPRRWRTIRDELGAATIGTFHSLCTQLLRRAPPHSGVSPHFELLEERDASALLRDLVERALLARVEQGNPLRTLVAEIGFGRLVEGLVPIATRIREEGVEPAYVHVADVKTLRAQFESELASFKEVARSLQPTKPMQRERHPLLVAAAARLSWETLEQALPGAQDALARVQGWGELRDALTRLHQLFGACLVAPFEAEVRELLVESSRAYEDALRARGVLDFTGLLVQARNLLRDSLEARREAHARFRALLVDEFQDTNRLQLELVLLLAERRDGAPRPVSTAFEAQHQEIVALPQDPGFLAVVGDRKQSIYEFRGADVSVFEVMARAIEANGGGRAYLRHSRRSTGALLEVLNAGFGQVLGPAAASSPPQDFEVVYVPEHDDLAAVRQGAPRGVPVLQLEDSRLGSERHAADVLRAADAEAVARAISAGLSSDWTVLEGRGEERERPARGGDVAMLFQRFTQLELYRQALVRHGVRHRVVRGRGFYGAQEIVDLASLLAVLADPDDALSLSAVLRSPLVGLTDAEWVSLAMPAEGPRWQLDARAVLTGRCAPRTPGAEAKVAQLRQRYLALREERDRLGLRALLRVVLEVFDYRVAVAAGPFGEQALANLEKLLVLASAREGRGVGVSAFARELLELADVAPRESQGEVVDELDREAVTLCTVHQAKGLEWPIVVLPDLATAPRTETAAIRFDRTLGLSIVRPRGATDLRSFSATQIGNQLTRRARAEHLRLLYVATTRARDRLVLGLRPTPSSGTTWATDLSAFFPLRVSGERPEVLDVASLTPRRVDHAAPSVSATEEVARILSAVRAPRRSATAAMVLPVTQLQDLASCPRRFHYAHQVGLAQRLGALAWREDEPGDDADVRARGTAVHKLLELSPLPRGGAGQGEGAPRGALSAALRETRRAAGLERLVNDDALGWVERFWSTDFARSLSSGLVHRELPFAVRLGGDDGPRLLVRGQIDLLVVRSNELVIVDYKTSTLPPGGVEPYRFQLGCYALAAQRFAGPLPVRAGIVFLRESSLEPRFLPVFEPEALAHPLAGHAATLAEAQRTGAWPGLPRSRCEALGCGYVYRCHP